MRGLWREFEERKGAKDDYADLLLQSVVTRFCVSLTVVQLRYSGLCPIWEHMVAACEWYCSAVLFGFTVIYRNCVDSSLYLLQALVGSGFVLGIHGNPGRILRMFRYILPTNGASCFLQSVDYFADLHRSQQRNPVSFCRGCPKLFSSHVEVVELASKM